MPQRQPRLFFISIFALRLLLPAWIGAAILYVITSVAEQTSPSFDSVTRDQLATVRFPLYYMFGMAIYIVSLAGSVVAWQASDAACRRRTAIVLALMVVSAVIFAMDYFMVYSPLQALIIPPGQVRTQEFVSLHKWSRHANELHLLITLVAAVLVTMPLKTESRRFEEVPPGI